MPIVTFPRPKPSNIYGIKINIAELRDQISKKHTADPEVDIREIAGKKIEDIRQQVITNIRKKPMINFQNCAVRAAISCLGELIKNSYDAGASILSLQLTDKTLSEAPGWSVTIMDNGRGFTDDFLSNFQKISIDEAATAVFVYPDLRKANTRDALRPYESTKIEGDRTSITGGANLGLKYLALTVQGDARGAVYIKNNTGSRGAQFFLIAGTEPACYGFDEIISFRSEKGCEPLSPDDIKRASPPPPRSGSPVPR